MSLDTFNPLRLERKTGNRIDRQPKFLPDIDDDLLREITMSRIFGFVAVLLITFELCIGTGSWKCKPAEREWSEREIWEVLQYSPWVSRRSIRVLDQPKDMAGKPLPTVSSYLSWVRFTWLAGPVRYASERAWKHSSVSLGSEINDFLIAFRHLPWREHPDGPPFDKSSVYILVTGSVLPDIIENDSGHRLEEAFMRTSGGRIVKAAQVFFGIDKPSYARSDLGVSDARVRLEDLRQNRNRGWNVEKQPPTKLVFEDEFPKNHYVSCVLLVFPRQIKGKPILTPDDRKVTLEIPVSKKSLMADFKVKDMVCGNHLEF
ncbi:MAG: hypothetical protein ACRD1R_08135 [Acidobacteriota bacterium]